MDEKSNELIDQLNLDIAHQAKLKKHNIWIRNKLLFIWAPWNGKTTIAKHIWFKLWIPTYIVRTWSIITAKMWLSSNNIEAIFKWISGRCVIFFDELDTFCLKRNWSNDQSATTENDRVTNQFIIWLDNLSSDVILIGATNMGTKLDPAVMRRFDIVHELNNPDKEAKISFTESLLKYHKFKWEKIEGLWDNVDKCATYNDIEKYVVNSIRSQIFTW